MHLCHQCLQEEKICLSLLEACLPSLCVSSTMFAPGTLLWTGAPLGFCYSIFLPLFAQRLRAIIGTNTLHYSYLCTHARVQKTSACKCAQEANLYLCTLVHGHTRLPACTATTNTQMLPLPLAWRCVLCGFVRCSEAPHSWQHLWKVRLCRESPGKQIGECRCPLVHSLPLLLLRSSIRFPPKSRAAPCREQTLHLQESTLIRQ